MSEDIQAEQAIAEVVESIWEIYDVDKSGDLDKEETRKFCNDTMGEKDESGNTKGISDEDFDEIFEKFDEDGSGTVDKDEMVAFIK